MKVAVLYICTGAYTVFWKEFYESCEQYFLPDCEKHYYVFTDADSLEYFEGNSRIHRQFREPADWPYNTLMRFHMFLEIKEELLSYDYVIFLNANCQCVDTISERDFLPDQEGLVVVKHPGFYDKAPKNYTYDRNRRSTAYIPYGKGNVYVCGGVNGGRAEVFLSMAEELAHNIDIDLSKNVIALWHDESHINHYIVEHPAYKLLSPSYCWPEGWNLPFEPKILIREKSRYFDVDTFKGYNQDEKRAGVLGCLKRLWKR